MRTRLGQIQLGFVERLILVLSAVMVLVLALPRTGMAAGRGVPRKILWMEAGANLRLLSTSEGVEEVLDRARAGGFDTVVPEAKNAWGYVTYPSQAAPFIGTSPVPRPWDPEYPPPREWYPQDYDLLATVIREAHARGIKVHAAINIFGEALTSYRVGLLYERPDWQAVHYLASRPVLAPDGSSFDLAGVNREPGANELTLITPVGPRPSGAVYTSVAVAEWRVKGVTDGTKGIAVPPKGFLLLGHGEAGKWLKEHFKPGDIIRLGPVTARFVPSTQYSAIAFANPVHPLVRLRMLAIIMEVITRYPVDGIILDRIRFPDVTADFSEFSQKSFEEYLGRKVTNWPEDIFSYQPTELWLTRRPGPLYKEWLAWRAVMIRRFIDAAARIVRSLRPDVSFAAYVGGWYPAYWSEGVNWASPDYLPPYKWASPAWQDGAIADYLDYLLVGLYYREVGLWDAFRRQVPLWRSVAGGAFLVKEVVSNATPVVGSVFLGLYPSHPSQAKAAMQVAYRSTKGVMVFDLVYLNLYNWWSLLGQ